MADAARARRLAKRIIAIVATEIEHQVKDPRLAMVTITAARVTADLRDATVFYTVYGDDTEVADTAIALASATGILRSAVGRQTGIKFTPTLTFQPDVVPEHSRYIEELLLAAKASDAAVAERAAGAVFAGEADPYRQPRVPQAETDEAHEWTGSEFVTAGSDVSPIDGSGRVDDDGSGNDDDGAGPLVQDRQGAGDR